MDGCVKAREKISRETFEQKLRHPLASKMRKQVEEWMSAFRDQDLRAMVAETQVMLMVVVVVYRPFLAGRAKTKEVHSLGGKRPVNACRNLAH